MTKVVLLVGTRKGCFVLESDGGRKDWEMRGPHCEGWPVYHAVYDHDGGSIFRPPRALRDGAARSPERAGFRSSSGSTSTSCPSSST